MFEMQDLLDDRWAEDLPDFDGSDEEEEEFDDDDDEWTFFDIIRSTSSYSLKYSGLRKLAKTFLFFVVLYWISTQLPSGFGTLRSWAKLEMIFICCAIFIPIILVPFLEPNDIPYEYVDFVIETIMWLVRFHFYVISVTKDAQLLYVHQQDIANILKEFYFPHLYVLRLYIYFFY